MEVACGSSTGQTRQRWFRVWVCACVWGGGVCVRKHYYVVHPSLAFPGLRAPQLPLMATRGSCSSGYCLWGVSGSQSPFQSTQGLWASPHCYPRAQGADETLSACLGVLFQGTTHRGSGYSRGGYLWILPAFYCQRFRDSQSKTNEAVIKWCFLYLF